MQIGQWINLLIEMTINYLKDLVNSLLDKVQQVHFDNVINFNEEIFDIYNR
jgi:hypothetical protein